MSEKVKARLIEIAVAFFAATAIILLAQFAAERQRASTPASLWFQVNEIFVPDFVHGDRVAVVYDTVTLDTFESFRIVEVQRQSKAGVWSSVCAGATIEMKDPRIVIENKTVSWEWLVGSACDVPPGEYRLRVTFAMSRPGWPAKRAFALSNVFIVKD